MADNVAITAGTGTTVGADEVVDGTLGTVKVQYVKIMDGTLDGTTKAAVSASGMKVDLGADNDVTVTSGTITAVTAITNALPAGTNAIGKLAANSGVDIGDVDVTSAVITGSSTAHDAADANNPIKVGFKAKSALSGVTAVASDDRTDAYSDLDGVQVVRANGAIGDYVNGTASNTDGTSTQVLAAGAAGVKHYITDVTIANTSSSNIYVELKDGSTAKWVFPVPANGGVTHSFATPVGGTAATAWNFDPSGATTTVYCSVSGYKSKL